MSHLSLSPAPSHFDIDGLIQQIYCWLPYRGLDGCTLRELYTALQHNTQNNLLLSSQQQKDQFSSSSGNIQYYIEPHLEYAIFQILSRNRRIRFYRLNANNKKNEDNNREITTTQNKAILPIQYTAEGCLYTKDRVAIDRNELIEFTVKEVQEFASDIQLVCDREWRQTALGWVNEKENNSNSSLSSPTTSITVDSSLQQNILLYCVLELIGKQHYNGINQSDLTQLLGSRESRQTFHYVILLRIRSLITIIPNTLRNTNHLYLFHFRPENHPSPNNAFHMDLSHYQYEISQFREKNRARLHRKYMELYEKQSRSITLMKENEEKSAQNNDEGNIPNDEEKGEMEDMNEIRNNYYIDEREWISSQCDDRHYEQSLPHQLYESIYRSGIRGITSSQLKQQIHGNRYKLFDRSLMWCMKYADVVSMAEQSHKSLTYKYFTKQNYELYQQFHNQTTHHIVAQSNMRAGSMNVQAVVPLAAPHFTKAIRKRKKQKEENESIAAANNTLFETPLATLTTNHVELPVVPPSIAESSASDIASEHVKESVSTALDNTAAIGSISSPPSGIPSLSSTAAWPSISHSQQRPLTALLASRRQTVLDVLSSSPLQITSSITIRQELSRREGKDVDSKSLTRLLNSMYHDHSIQLTTIIVPTFIGKERVRTIILDRYYDLNDISVKQLIADTAQKESQTKYQLHLKTGDSHNDTIKTEDNENALSLTTTAAKSRSSAKKRRSQPMTKNERAENKKHPSGKRHVDSSSWNDEPFSDSAASHASTDNLPPPPRLNQTAPISVECVMSAGAMATNAAILNKSQTDLTLFGDAVSANNDKSVIASSSSPTADILSSFPFHSSLPAHLPPEVDIQSAVFMFNNMIGYINRPAQRAHWLHEILWDYYRIHCSETVFLASYHSRDICPSVPLHNMFRYSSFIQHLRLSDIVLLMGLQYRQWDEIPWLFDKEYQSVSLSALPSHIRDIIILDMQDYKRSVALRRAFDQLIRLQLITTTTNPFSRNHHEDSTPFLGSVTDQLIYVLQPSVSLLSQQYDVSTVNGRALYWNSLRHATTQCEESITREVPMIANAALYGRQSWQLPALLSRYHQQQFHEYIYQEQHNNPHHLPLSPEAVVKITKQKLRSNIATQVGIYYSYQLFDYVREAHEKLQILLSSHHHVIDTHHREYTANKRRKKLLSTLFKQSKQKEKRGEINRKGKIKEEDRSQSPILSSTAAVHENAGVEVDDVTSNTDDSNTESGEEVGEDEDGLMTDTSMPQHEMVVIEDSSSNEGSNEEEQHTSDSDVEVIPLQDAGSHISSSSLSWRGRAESHHRTAVSTRSRWKEAEDEQLVTAYNDWILQHEEYFTEGQLPLLPDDMRLGSDIQSLPSATSPSNNSADNITQQSMIGVVSDEMNLSDDTSLSHTDFLSSSTAVSNASTPSKPLTLSQYIASRVPHRDAEQCRRRLNFIRRRFHLPLLKIVKNNNHFRSPSDNGNNAPSIQFKAAAAKAAIYQRQLSLKHLQQQHVFDNPVLYALFERIKMIVLEPETQYSADDAYAVIESFNESQIDTVISALHDDAWIVRNKRNIRGLNRSWRIGSSFAAAIQSSSSLSPSITNRVIRHIHHILQQFPEKSQCISHTINLDETLNNAQLLSSLMLATNDDIQLQLHTEADDGESIMSHIVRPMAINDILHIHTCCGEMVSSHELEESTPTSERSSSGKKRSAESLSDNEFFNEFLQQKKCARLDHQHLFVDEDVKQVQQRIVSIVKSHGAHGISISDLSSQLQLYDEEFSSHTSSLIESSRVTEHSSLFARGLQCALCAVEVIRVYGYDNERLVAADGTADAMWALPATQPQDFHPLSSIIAHSWRTCTGEVNTEYYTDIQHLIYSTIYHLPGIPFHSLLSHHPVLTPMEIRNILQRLLDDDRVRMKLIHHPVVSLFDDEEHVQASESHIDHCYFPTLHLTS